MSFRWVFSIAVNVVLYAGKTEYIMSYTRKTLRSHGTYKRPSRQRVAERWDKNLFRKKVLNETSSRFLCFTEVAFTRSIETRSW